jgi:exosortase
VRPAAAVAETREARRVVALPYVLTALTFAVLFAKPAIMLAGDWWNNPEAGHGLLLFPVAVWLAWRTGIRFRERPRFWLGLSVLVGAVLLRVVADLAAERYMMRISMVLALAGLVVLLWGIKQLLAWWLPFVLLTLAIPLPELITSAMALPLQFRASKLGAALLAWRDIPVRLSGNILDIPGHRLFVTEACSGLRSLTALLSVSVLTAGLWLKAPLTRVLLVLAAIPVAILINGVRVFMTGFLVYFVDPKMGEGFMHMTEGWLLFLVSLLVIGAVTLLFQAVERVVRKRLRGASDAVA